MNKGLFFLLTILMFFTLAISCTSSQKTSDEANISLKQQSATTKVRWLGQWYGEGKKEVLVREMVREFELLNQDIDVDLTFPYQAVGIDSFADPFRLVTDSLVKWVGTNSWPYDILLCDKYFYAEVVRLTQDNDWGEKYLIDFRNEKWYKDSQKEYVLASDEYTGNFGGIAPGAFLEGLWNILFVSSVVEEKLGIKVKECDMTIDDFIEYAQKVNSYNQSHSDKITFCATNYMTMEAIINQLVLSELGTNRNSDPLKALANVYNKIEILSQYMPDKQYHRYNNDRELKQDDALFHLHSTWVTMFWQRTNPEGEKKMKPCEFPSMNGKTAPAYSGIYNCTFVIPKNAKNRDAAIRLMKFISSADVAEKWESYTKCPTGLRSRMSMNEFGTDDFSNFSKHLAKKYDNKLIDATLSKILFGKSVDVRFYPLDVLRGSMTAKEAIEKIRSQVK
jgi:ABC-type glycerol-3-phosphate transport system substrate-binding protein